MGTVGQPVLLMHHHMFGILTKEQLSLTSRTLHMHWRNQPMESGETGFASALDIPRHINGFVLTLPIKPLTSLLRLSQTSCLGTRLTAGPGIKKLKEKPWCGWGRGDLASPNTAKADCLILQKFKGVQVWPKITRSLGPGSNNYRNVKHLLP